MQIDKLFPMLFRVPEAEGAGGTAGGSEQAAAATGADSQGGAAEGDKGAVSLAEQGETGAEAAGGDTGAEGGEGEKKQAGTAAERFPDNWKDLLLSGLPEDQRTIVAKSKRLDRASSPIDLVRTIVAQDSRIGELSNRVKLPTGKDDDAKEVAAFRKAFGIPEAADKYALPKTADGKEMTEAERSAWEQFLPDLHAANISQRQLDAIAKVDAIRTQQAMKARQEAVAKAAEAAQEDLRVEWGRDYKANINLANRFLSEHMKGFVKDGEGAILDKRFSDGTALGEHPAFVKMVVALAKQMSDDGALELGETTEGFDPETKLAEMMKVRTTDRAKYNSPAFQAELMKINAMVDRRAGKGGNRNSSMGEQARG